MEKKSIKPKLYRPVIVRKEVEDTHYYYVNGVFFPSVTKILQETLPTPPALKYWLGEVGNERAQQKLEKAGERGTKIHNACELLLKGGTIDLEKEFPDNKDKKCIISFIDWAVQAKPKFKNKGIEFVLASKYGYAGTGDFLCYINNEPWIIDFKTSAGVYLSHLLQITSYQWAIYEMTGIKPRRGILHLNPQTKRGWTLHDKIEIEGKDVTINDFLKDRKSVV
jgi:hypothetical protein